MSEAAVSRTLVLDCVAAAWQLTNGRGWRRWRLPQPRALQLPWRIPTACRIAIDSIAAEQRKLNLSVS